MRSDNNKKRSILRRLREFQRGQMLIGVLLLGIAMAAVVAEFGTVYFAYQQLQAQTEAAALAGGSVMSNDGETGTDIQNTAKAYSGGSGDANPANTSLMTVTSITATPKCLTSATAAAEGVPACNTYSIGDNALLVTETATVPTTFARALGWNNWTISSTAMASAKGGFNGPYNVAIILDTTSSMNTEDAGNCNGSRITCALQGVQTLLSTLSPCPGGLASCGSASSSSVAVPSPASGDENAENVPQAVDEVGLFTFPGLAASGSSIGNVQDDINCPTKNPPITSYNQYFDATNCTGSGVPLPCCTGNGKGATCATTANPPVYEVVPFSSDYRSSDTVSSLTSSSDLVIAVGGGCSSGLAAPGGENTFYAGVIDTAQSALATEAAARPNTKNVMILVSDGEANATTAEGMAYPTPKPSTTYSATGQCQQAVTEAQKAATAGTTVYSVAYGAEASGCTTDSGTYASPICTMQGIANSPSSSSPGYMQNNSNFFSDVTSTKSGCASDARSTTTLDQIFKAIAGDLTVSRLIPASTT